MPIDSFEMALTLLAASGGLIFAALAVRQKDLVRSIISYGVSSAFLATLFFLLASPFAAMLELTVGAGLIVVLFLVALTLSTGSEDQAVETEGKSVAKGGGQ